MDLETEKDRAKGILYGLAIGDALGGPVEFMRLDQIRQTYGPGGLRDFAEETGKFTDDTEMSLAVAYSLIEAGGSDLETFMGSVRSHFIEWRKSPQDRRAPGATCLQGVHKMEEGVHWNQSGVRASKGCGSAMRTAPIGYFYSQDPVRLLQFAYAAGYCTHPNPVAVAACQTAAYCVCLILNGTEPLELPDRTLAILGNLSPEFNECLKKVKQCLNWPKEEEALISLGEKHGNWTAEEVVSSALYCYLKYPKDYKSCVLRAANTGGDSDSVACIAGSLSGAALGLKGIPSDWVRRVEKSAHLAETAERLAEKKLSLRKT